MKFVNVHVDQMQVFLIINNDGMKINAGGNVKNWLIKEVVIIDLLGILVVLNVNVINHINVNVMLENIWTNKTSAEKNQLIIYLKNVLKMLMKKKSIQQNCVQKKQFCMQFLWSLYCTFFFVFLQ